MSSCLCSVFLLLFFMVQASLQALSLCNMWHVSVCLADVQKHALLIFSSINKVYENLTKCQKKKKTEKLSSDVPFKILSPIVYQMFVSISLISHVYIDFFEKCKFCAYVTVLHPNHPDIATLPHPIVWVLGWN